MIKKKINELRLNFLTLSPSTVLKFKYSHILRHIGHRQQEELSQLTFALEGSSPCLFTRSLFKAAKLRQFLKNGPAGGGVQAGAETSGGGEGPLHRVPGGPRVLQQP